MYDPWEIQPLTKGVQELALGAQPTQITPPAGKEFLFTGNQVYDYSRLLSDHHQKLGHKLVVDHSDHGSITAHILNGEEYIGGVDGQMDGTDLNIDQAEVMPMHRGQGLGTPLYEAMLAHGAHKFNADRWVGGDHSSSAHKLHERLTAKHGLKYEGGQPNIGTKKFPTMEAWKSAPNENYDKKFSPYAITLKSELNSAIDQTELVLAKMLPTPTFPQVGVPDDRRETKMITTPAENATMKGVVRNALPASLEGAKTRAKAADAVYDRGAGAAMPSTTGVVSYAKPNSSNQPVTALHENVHRIFQRIEDKYGRQARANFSRNLVAAIPNTLGRFVERYGKAAAGKTQMPHEEMIGHLISYLNDSKRRTAFHTSSKFNEKQGHVHHAIMKRAYKHLQAASQVANEKWFQPVAPWSQNG